MLNFNINIPWNVVMIVVWIAVIAIGIIVEAQTSELVSIWFAISGAVAIVCAIAGLSIPIQVAVFSTLTLLLVICTRPLVKKFTKNTEVKTNADKLVGMIGVITKDVKDGERGSVKVEYQEWTAIAKNNQTFSEGTKVVISEIIGNKLVVECIEEIEIK